jgi:recombination protein RecA
LSDAPEKLSPSASRPNLAKLISQLHGYKPVDWIRTGIPAIDLVIGAGIPRGRMVEVVGEYATAKSALGYIVIGAFQRAGGQCILLDSEAKTDKGFAEKIGNFEWDKIGYLQPKSIKESIQLIGKVAQQADPKIPTILVWDSLAATAGSDELEFAISDEERKSEMAARARELSASFRATQGELSRNNVTFFVINQLRTKLNFMGKSFQESSGGKAPKYHAAVRLMMRMKGKIRHKERDVITGVAIDIEAMKNTMAPPFRHATLKFKFDTGFDPYSGLDEFLLRHGRITQRAGWLVYGDKTFRGADMERIAAEMPGLVAPLFGIIDGGVAPESAEIPPGAEEAGAEVTALTEDES